MVVIDRIRCNKSEVLLVKTSPLGSLYFLKEVKRENWRRLQNLGRCCEFDVFIAVIAEEILTKQLKKSLKHSKI